ncbi:maltose/moltooligosaccharide transporter [Roseivirga pacifica]|uniref:Maltose/moltooligosaccharide transporter n=1 Tax=Roseivirga pacifica TaxID=1267423 RepID=A0A1I0NK97_9BACT|nr:MFS transporter [Roseivirga pacifica]MCO6359801.1 MFS transporter [Roseivirga pacifica]MCO6367171.1 MFS transporter [Roseivirga pacifica]MCO6370297.1 MFS transporter [Roseivirga pacifica]MCO6374828.1 MFS transporter [Roseivirga pacifica]MCO6380086.1 MFS transporter [Roseivirga pacifica]
MSKRPRLSFLQIWNMSFGFLGIQMGFALQNANASRILQIFGADVEHLSLFWIVAPLTGMIVQPIIGHYSDRTWTKIGRRRPYFLTGAILAAIGLILMPRADLFIAFLPALWVGAGFLMIMDASFNIAMEPFRALVADKLPSDQRTLGFSVQTILIGIGAVIGSWLPWAITNWFNVPNTAAEGQVPPSLVWSFICGAIVLIITILITVFTTKEYTPEETAAFEEEDGVVSEPESSKGFLQIFDDIRAMPATMKQLGLVQFFSWFALYGMWVFSTPAIAHHIWGLPTSDNSSQEFQNAGDWVGIIFGVYNLVSAIYAFFLPAIAKKVGRKQTHAISLVIGGIGLISMYFAPDKYWLIGSMVCVGIAWASILAMPYAILAGSIPAKKMGIYMGLFNFFIVFPQITNAFVGGSIIKNFFGGNPMLSIVLSGVFMIFAALSLKVVKDEDDTITT